tara:strand:+ start:2891 stop:4072 length:1182 start_codon:yes stop_codon:yes gene_type:complete
MATKIFARLLAQNDKIFYQVKKRLRSEAEKKVMSLRNKIPSQNQLTNKFSSKYCSPSTIQRAEKDYNKYKRLIDKIEKKVQGAEKSINGLKRKIETVVKNVEKIKSIGDKLKKLIDILTKVVVAANVIIKGIGFIPSTQYFPNPSGPIVLAKDLMEKALAKIVLLNAAITGALAAISLYLNKAQNLLNGILSKILSVIADLLNRLKMIRQMLELFFLKLLRGCSISDGSNTKPGGATYNTIPITSAGGRPLRPEEYLAAIGYPGYSLEEIDLDTQDPTAWEDELGEFYDNTMANLSLAGRTEFIEKIYNARFQMIGFSRFFEGVDFDFVTNENQLEWASDYANNPPRYPRPSVSSDNYVYETTFQPAPTTTTSGGGISNTGGGISSTGGSTYS